MATPAQSQQSNGQSTISTTQALEELLALQNKVYCQVLTISGSIQRQMREDISFLDETLRFSLKAYENSLNEIVENYRLEREALLSNTLKEIEKITSDSHIKSLLTK